MTVLKISIRAGERIFVNGAVLRADRKVTLEFLNTVTFLLEQHVLAPDETTTPLRQLYFMIQSAIIDPKCAGPALEMARSSVVLLRSTFLNANILGDLEVVEDNLKRGRHFDCLRIIRRLFATEDAIISGARPINTDPIMSQAEEAMLAP
ncbi:MAG: flagellar biosynthesis repressor FlbT [Hyphomicrobium sp.]|nr:flagellar biosynthesis repressor FlbT [Hyphomicrobium sp.]